MISIADNFHLLVRARFACECSGQCGGRHPSGICAVPELAWISRRKDGLWQHEHATSQRRAICVVLRLAGDGGSRYLACQWCHMRARRNRLRTLSHADP